MLTQYVIYYTIKSNRGENWKKRYKVYQDYKRGINFIMALKNVNTSFGNFPDTDDYYDVDDPVDYAQELAGDDDDSNNARGEDDDNKGDDNIDDEDVDDDDVNDSKKEANGDDTDDDDTKNKDEDDDDGGDDDGDVSDEVHTPLFNEQQQAKINEIVQNRLERQERSIINRITSASGVDMEGMAEIERAAKLWGLLKENPELSAYVDQAINQAIQQGKARIPQPKQTSQTDTKLAELSKKEAILDLKASDKVFARYSNEILSWAEQEGFEITDERTLKLVYNAWRGANAQRLQKSKEKVSAKKKAEKQTKKQKAQVQKGKSKRSSAKPVDYRKKSDRDILAEEGLSLFVDD